jgi:hypothetical protein
MRARRMTEPAAKLPCEMRVVVESDGAVTEVSDEQPLAESPEVRGRKRESPRCVQTPTRAYPADQIAIAVEHVHESETNTGHVIFAVGVLLREGNIQVALNVPNTKRRIALRNAGVLECARQRDTRECLVEHVDLSIVEVRGVQKVSPAVLRESEPLVDSAAGPVVIR